MANPKLHTLPPFQEVGSNAYWRFDPMGNVNGAAHIVNNQLELSLKTSAGDYCQLASVQAYDFTNSFLVARVSQFIPDAIGMERSVILCTDPANQNQGVQFDFEHSGAGVPNCLFFVPGQANVFSGNLPDNNPYWVRAREAGGTITMEYSQDGKTWTLGRTIATATAFPSGATSVFVCIQFGADNGTAPPVAWYWRCDRLNRPPTVSGMGQITSFD